jgi:hypothetical protein
LRFSILELDVTVLRKEYSERTLSPRQSKIFDLIIGILLLILMKALAIQPALIQAGFISFCVVILILAYGAIRFIELRRRAGNQLKS